MPSLQELLDAMKKPFSTDAAETSPYLAQTQQDIGSIAPDANFYGKMDTDAPQRVEDRMGAQDYDKYLSSLPMEKADDVVSAVPPVQVADDADEDADSSSAPRQTASAPATKGSPQSTQPTQQSAPTKSGYDTVKDS